MGDRIFRKPMWPTTDGLAALCVSQCLLDMSQVAKMLRSPAVHSAVCSACSTGSVSGKNCNTCDAEAGPAGLYAWALLAATYARHSNMIGTVYVFSYADGENSHVSIMSSRTTSSVLSYDM